MPKKQDITRGTRNTRATFIAGFILKYLIQSLTKPPFL